MKFHWRFAILLWAACGLLPGSTRCGQSPLADAQHEFNAGRYVDPARFVSRLGALYPRMRHIDFDGNAAELTATRLLGDRSGEDWLLLFDEP